MILSAVLHLEDVSSEISHSDIFSSDVRKQKAVTVLYMKLMEALRDPADEGGAGGPGPHVSLPLHLSNAGPLYLDPLQLQSVTFNVFIQVFLADI